TIAMLRLELEFELRRLQLESEERITLYKIQLESEGSTQSSTGSRVGDQGPVDPVAQYADVPIWFDEVEKCLRQTGCRTKPCVHLIMPALTKRVRYLLPNLKLEDCADNQQVKRAVLDELQLARPEYCERFDNASKWQDENWTQFASQTTPCLVYFQIARSTYQNRHENVSHLLNDHTYKQSAGRDKANATKRAQTPTLTILTKAVSLTAAAASYPTAPHRYTASIFSWLKRANKYKVGLIVLY
ncbi:hypothetical protein HPB47_018405, partial [Ixodes persulcatus]